MTNSTLRQYEGDTCRIHRLQGNVYFQPYPLGGATPVAILTNNLAMNLYLRAGILKSETTMRNGGIPEAVEPLSGAFSPSPDQFSDWSEQSWMRLWEHNWPATGSMLVGTTGVAGCCSVVTGGASAIENGITWTITEGAIDTSISTECTPCGDGTVATGDLHGPLVRHPWHLHFDIRRTILMKENDSLDLWFGWENLMGLFETQRRAQPFVAMYGGVRALVEK